MDLKKYLFLLFYLLIILIGYSQPVISIAEQQSIISYRHEKKIKYKLKETDFKLPINCDLNLTAAYIHKFFSPSRKDTLFYFVRFFDDGRVFMSDYYFTEPTQEECDNLTYGKRGYYKIQDFLEMEFYLNTYDKFWIYKCKIKPYSLSYIEKEPRLLPFLTSKKEKQLIDVTVYLKNVNFKSNNFW